jgi:hypothetical protein
MEAEQEDNAEDDRGNEDLADVIVQDLLIRVRGVAEGGLFLRGDFRGGDWIGGDDGCVLFYIHVLTPLAATQNFPCVRADIHGGVPLLSRGKGVYNKGSLSLQLFFAKFCRFISKREMGLQR